MTFSHWAHSFALAVPVGAPLWKALRGMKYDFMEQWAVPPGSKRDLRVMERAMKGAESVTIFSGDFSFLADDSELRRTLFNLAHRENLQLASYKSRITVRDAASSGEPSYLELFDTVEGQGKAYYGL